MSTGSFSLNYPAFHPLRFLSLLCSKRDSFVTLWVTVALGMMPKALPAQEDWSLEAAGEEAPSTSWGYCCWSCRIQVLAAVQILPKILHVLRTPR